MMARSVRVLVTLAVVALMVLVAGCAGRDFQRPAPDAYTLKKTTYDQVIASLGKPYQEGTLMSNGVSLKTASYAYSSVGGAGAFDGITPARAVGFYFRDGVLVGQEFISSFKDDSTYFDERLAELAKKGMTREQGRAALGPATGHYLYPLIEDTRGEGWVYQYMHLRGFRQHRRQLLVEFDEAGSVTKSTYTSAGDL